MNKAFFNAERWWKEVKINRWLTKQWIKELRIVIRSSRREKERYLQNNYRLVLRAPVCMIPNALDEWLVNVWADDDDRGGVESERSILRLREGLVQRRDQRRSRDSHRGGGERGRVHGGGRTVPCRWVYGKKKRSWWSGKKSRREEEEKKKKKYRK